MQVSYFLAASENPHVAHVILEVGFFLPKAEVAKRGLRSISTSRIVSAVLQGSTCRTAISRVQDEIQRLAIEDVSTARRRMGRAVSRLKAARHQNYSKADDPQYFVPSCLIAMKKTK
jgi:hypothetical protein